MNEHIQRKHKVQNIGDKAKFMSLLENAMLDEIDSRIMVKIYVEHCDMNKIADDLGMSESNVRKRHRKALMRIADKL